MGENPTGPRRASGGQQWILGPCAAPQGAVHILTAHRDDLWIILRPVWSGAIPTSLALHLAVGFIVSATGPELADVRFDCGTGYLLVAAPPSSPTLTGRARSPAT